MQLTAAIVAEHLEPILKQILVFFGVGALGCQFPLRWKAKPHCFSPAN